MRWLVVVLLTGCQALEPRVITIKEPIEIQVAVPVSCISSIPPRPRLLTDEDLLAMGDYQAVLGLRRNLLVLAAHVAELEAVLAGCRSGV